MAKKDFNPSGEKGKLHRELGISTDKTIPAGRLAKATRSDNPEIRRDAIRAKTMKAWNHSGAHHNAGGCAHLAPGERLAFPAQDGHATKVTPTRPV